MVGCCGNLSVPPKEMSETLYHLEKQTREPVKLDVSSKTPLQLNTLSCHAKSFRTPAQHLGRTIGKSTQRGHRYQELGDRSYH